ncbi:MAG: pitrilysin family protein [Bacteroidota bacterium]
MTLNRTIAPEIQDVEKIEFVKPSHVKLNNGLQLFCINAGSQDVIRLEVFFNAGSKYANHPLLASTVNALLKEGTSKMNSQQIAEHFDYYGSFLENETSKDHSSITLYTLNKHLASTLPVFVDIITNPSFPEKEFDIYNKNAKQKFSVNQKKVDYQARNLFPKLLFGANSPFGSAIAENDYNTINIKQIVDFFETHYSLSNATIIVSGKVSDAELNSLKSAFENIPSKQEAKTKIDTSIDFKPNKVVELKDDAIQSAIRIGRPLVTKTHKDYQALQVVNTIFGGYFGSRLMSNIREDKGYTYGIGSGVVSMNDVGYFVISTEVGVDVCASALNEIYFELKRLREELVSDDELDLVKNYMLGTLLRSAEGAFAMADKFKGIYFYGLDYTYYDNYIKTIHSITPEQIKNLCATYFQEKDLTELVVGKK